MSLDPKELQKAAEDNRNEFINNIKRRREKRNKGKSKWQRSMEISDNIKANAADLRHLMDIEAKLRQKDLVIMPTSRMVCPSCGDVDRNNTVNGRPWCVRCNVPLTEKSLKNNNKRTIIKAIPKIESLKKEAQVIIPEPSNIVKGK